VAKGGIRRGSSIRVTARVLSELLLLLKAEASLLDFDKRRSTFLFLILPPLHDWCFAVVSHRCKAS
jgi:hypothetical protein